MGDAPLEGDGLELRPARGLPAAARIAAFSMLHDLGRALQGADLADPRDVAPVPFDPELEVLVGIEPLGVDRELCHGTSEPAQA